MRGLHFDLTGRGLTMLVFGGLIATGAFLIGEPDLVWVRVPMTCLPVVGLAVVLALPSRLTCKRSVAPGSLPVGKMARVWLSVMSSRTISFSALGSRDRLPDALDRDVTPKLIRGLGCWYQATRYDVATRQRGHSQIGLPRVRNLDVFGVAWCSWQAIGNITSLHMTPRLWALSPSGGRWVSGVSRDATPQHIGSAGIDDVPVHEHRHGNGMRRMYWKMSAKRGELMVRLGEQP